VAERKQVQYANGLKDPCRRPVSGKFPVKRFEIRGDIAVTMDDPLGITCGPRCEDDFNHIVERVVFKAESLRPEPDDLVESKNRRRGSAGLEIDSGNHQGSSRGFKYTAD